MPNIAILGWGSLLWDKCPTFDDYHGAWEADGPELKIEFSRVSETRSGALTLAIDPINGSLCRVSYARSTRTDPEDAICDLRCREGTIRRNIGYFSAPGNKKSQARDSITLKAVEAWARSKAFDVVVWTDLPSNFQQKLGKPFTVDDALAHLTSLPDEAKAGAAEYVKRAPAFVNTPLRHAIQSLTWYRGIR